MNLTGRRRATFISDGFFLKFYFKSIYFNVLTYTGAVAVESSLRLCRKMKESRVKLRVKTIGKSRSPRPGRIDGVRVTQTDVGINVVRVKIN